MANTQDVTGWAVVDIRGRIARGTVGQTQRETMVCWLAAAGVYAHASHTDDDVLGMFERHKGSDRLVPVVISAIEADSG